MSEKKQNENIEMSKLLDSDGNEVEAITKEKYEENINNFKKELEKKYTVMIEKERNKNVSFKKLKDMTEEEKSSLKKDNQLAYERIEGLESQLDKIKTEKITSLKSNRFSNLDEEDRAIAERNFNLIRDDAEWAELSQEEIVTKKADLAINMMGKSIDPISKSQSQGFTGRLSNVKGDSKLDESTVSFLKGIPGADITEEKIKNLENK